MDTNDLMNDITDMLLSFKVQPGNMGFDFLRTGIKYCIEDCQLKNNITKSLYPMVAQAHKTTADTVERGMRTAIENAYNSGGLLEINEFCDMVVYNNDFKWTNGEMISTIVELIHMKKGREYLDEHLFEDK